MAAKTVGDQFSNLIVSDLTMTAINTISFLEINVGLNIFDKVGLIVERCEYTPSGATLSDLDTDADAVSMGLVSSNAIANMDPDQSEIIDVVTIQRHDMGAAASGWLHRNPIINDFSTMGGGGLLIPPKPLYVAMASGGMTVVGRVFLRLFFRILKLESDQYLELLETRRAFG